MKNWKKKTPCRAACVDGRGRRRPQLRSLSGRGKAEARHGASSCWWLSQCPFPRQRLVANRPKQEFRDYLGFTASSVPA